MTIEAIAQEAGLARRTVFRYVSSKDELAFVHHLLWLDVFEAALLADTSDTLAERLRLSSRAIALHIDEDPEPVRQSMQVVAAHPELAQGASRVMQVWIDRVAAEVVQTGSSFGDGQDELRARVIGAATMGMVDAVLRQWSALPVETPFVPLYDIAFAVLQPLLEVEQAG